MQTQRGVAVETIEHLAIDEARVKRIKALLTNLKKLLEMDLIFRILEKMLLAPIFGIMEELALEQTKSTRQQTVSFWKESQFPRGTGKAASLLGLPAEIRWEIYQYLFEPHRVEILRRKDKNTNTSRPARYRLYHRQQKPRNPSTQAVFSNGHRTRPTPFLFGLVFTCRTIYCEAVLLLYSTAQFIFSSSNSIMRFLRTTSKDHQAAVRHVELSHIMYNEPRLMAFRTFKIRSDIAWYIACDEMASACVSLKVLHVRLAIYDWPIRLKIGEPWSMPLLLFGHYDGGLDYAGVSFK
ncbi:hypothetical protein ANOM_009008 [Aspergillus nomiae NRRL 13137]|uniref:DUF7730 domain-containing protein n=1 Tax=Aspergillus nomiae NRRL (strain ATCC 15546 / NRRL 13137 / CBS 260.88 / M93) TaxID=1509407 RepID=A0A0L1IV43_ASPN3|nr:uncharacterized protein ANOM_009008 [Aspergillus nomiae NRRL 13137]KNG83367.1 hypothetical protein ANOM_009008 [Aspergillus nomiae NRRL 13137]